MHSDKLTQKVKTEHSNKSHSSNKETAGVPQNKGERNQKVAMVNAENSSMLENGFYW